jgi:hypothetical protein
MDSGYRRRKLFDDDDEDEGAAQGKYYNHLCVLKKRFRLQPWTK